MSRRGDPYSNLGAVRFLKLAGAAGRDYRAWQRHTPASEGPRPAAAEAKRARRRARNLVNAERMAR